MKNSMNNMADIIETIAPLELAEEWDNCGWQLKLDNFDSKKAMISLDITKETVQEAIERKVGLIVTHHPLFFGSISAIEEKTTLGKNIVNLIRCGISVYSAHTNFDKAVGGNNDYMANKLSLINVNQVGDYLRIGELTTGYAVEEFREYLSKALKCSYDKITVVGNESKRIKKVGVCTGAGASYWNTCMANGADALVTGDVKYHDALMINENEYTVFDCRHFQTEILFVENMVKILEKKCNEIELIPSTSQVDPFS